MPHPISAALSARPPWQPATLTRALSRVSGSVRDVSAVVDEVERHWHRLAATTLESIGAIPYEPLEQLDEPPEGRLPLWVVLGDSTAQGIGASNLDHAWVSRLHAALADAGRPHVVLNLSRSGALSHHVIDEQLPLLDHLPYEPAVVTICVGANDLMRTPVAPVVADRLRRLAEHAPPGCIIATLPVPRVSPVGWYVNRALQQAAEQHGHRVADLTPHLMGPLRGTAADRYHPNDAGYGAWVRAFAEPLGVDPDLVPLRGTLTSAGPAPARP